MPRPRSLPSTSTTTASVLLPPPSTPTANGLYNDSSFIVRAGVDVEWGGDPCGRPRTSFEVVGVDIAPQKWGAGTLDPCGRPPTSPDSRLEKSPIITQLPTHLAA